MDEYETKMETDIYKRNDEAAKLQQKMAEDMVRNIIKLKKMLADIKAEARVEQLKIRRHYEVKVNRARQSMERMIDACKLSINSKNYHRVLAKIEAEERQKEKESKQKDKIKEEPPGEDTEQGYPSEEPKDINTNDNNDNNNEEVFSDGEQERTDERY